MREGVVHQVGWRCLREGAGKEWRKVLYNREERKREKERESKTEQKN